MKTMKTVLKATIGLAVVCLLAIGALAVAPSLRASLTEHVKGETPQAKAKAYLRYVSKGDVEKALSLWKVPSLTNSDRQGALEKRRISVTNDLAQKGISRYELEDIEWWATCCEPRVISSPRDAGGARLKVRIVDRNGKATEYIFDIFVPGGYWGKAAGYPTRHWNIMDVYPVGENPIYWRAHGTKLAGGG